MTLKLRPAHPGDADALTDILHRSKASWGYADDKMAAFRSEYRIKSAMLATRSFLVAERSCRPVGFADGYTEGNDFNLDFLFVSPEEQRKGTGKLLLERMCDRARLLGKSRIILESDAHAVDFYQKNGFAIVSNRPSQMAPGLKIPLMDRPVGPVIQQIDRIDLSFNSDLTWSFAASNLATITDHWRELTCRNPNLWNGQTLKLRDLDISNGCLSGVCLETDYASFLAWRDWGFPDLNVANVFGSAVIRSSDGALLFGKMADSTANAGKIYPPGGSLEPDDIGLDGKVDVIGSIARELQEETGLDIREAVRGPVLFVDDGPLKSIALILDFPETAEVLRDTILANIRQLKEDELAGIVVLRSASDMDGLAVVPYARRLAHHLL